MTISLRKIFTNKNSNLSLLSNVYKFIYKKGFFHLLATNYSIQILGFSSQIFVAWLMAPKDIGVIKLYQTYLSLAIIVAGFGLNTSLLKLASEKCSDSYRNELLVVAKQVSFYMSVLIIFLLGVMNYFTLFFEDPIYKFYFYIYIFTLLPSTFINIYICYYQAIKQIKKIAYL